MDASVSVSFCNRGPKTVYDLANSNRSAPPSPAARGTVAQAKFRERIRLLKNSLGGRFHRKSGQSAPSTLLLGLFKPDVWSLLAQRRLFQQAGIY
jgi:hypothetical protein